MGLATCTPANILSSQVLQLYSNAADSDLVASCLYCSDATFTDPLVSVSGLSHIQAQFRLMRLLLRGSDIEMNAPLLTAGGSGVAGR